MAKTINDIHNFLEHNLQDYARRDVLAICKFFLRLKKIGDKKPLATTIIRFHEFKNFICKEWQGIEINGDTRPFKKKEVPVHGSCSCGGIFIIRTNRRDGNQFLGCSKFPRCNQTKEL